ncbi:MAG TPA: ABC transporter permease [Ferruginibacter sp.]|nr:ABC transporter permease [Ferruginibacter sp.]HRE62810.1 ABC transporter permease [Ferruginibacter sp.]
MTVFLNSLVSEWIKKSRSFADWLVWLGAFFVPIVNTIIFLVYPNQILKLHQESDFWNAIFYRSWETMSIMLLPMGIVLAVSLITQIEFKNNCWKQLHTLPISFSSIYFSKFIVLLVMLVQLIVLFNIGIIFSCIIPAVFNSNIPFPSLKLPWQWLLLENGKFFIVSIPLLSLQYLLSLQFKNFLIPIGAGLALVIGGLIALSWKYVFLLPFSYNSLFFFQTLGKRSPEHNILLWSLAYFVLFTLVGYILYLFKKEKG